MQDHEQQSSTETATAAPRAVYCAPLAGHPGAYTVRPAGAEPYGDQDAVITRGGDGWVAMWGLDPHGFWQHQADLPGGLVDVGRAARAAVDVMAAAR